jgi:hypothetical protein
MRQGDWKLLLMRDGTNPQLYNLQSDPSEADNQAAKHPDIVKRMSPMLLTWSQSLPGHQVSVNAPAGGGDIGF